MASHEYDYDVEDVEYLRIGDQPLLTRLFKPKGKGPFPAIVEAHGGGWVLNTRVKNIAIHEALAKSGVIVAGLDFRMPPEASYPASLTEINYGIRWMKLNAERFGGRPDWVGTLGSSSGGHQVLLNGMQPEKYATIALPAGSPKLDAKVRCVVACWPVVDPLLSYHYIKKANAEGTKFDSMVNPSGLVKSCEDYFGTEAIMSEANPLQLLERGDKVELPPAVYIKTDKNPFSPPGTTERFAEAYRKAGGAFTVEEFPGTDYLFTTYFPSAPQSLRALQKITEFVHQHIK